ncbi:MAG: hypothetical protein R3E77_02420 [Steroidobacteraceae bacterium]
MRTTLTLDDDVASRLQAEARRSGRPFGVVVNEYLRAGLAQRRAVQDAAPFRVRATNLGGPVRGHSYDDIGALLDEVEGAAHR